MEDAVHAFAQLVQGGVVADVVLRGKVPFRLSKREVGSTRGRVASQ